MATALLTKPFNNNNNININNSIQKKPRNYWKNKTNQKEFLINLAEKLKFEDNSHWYTIQQNKIAKNGGKPLLKLYKSDIYLLLRENIEYDWNLLKFTNISHQLEDLNFQKKILDSFYERNNLKSASEWLNISTIKSFNSYFICKSLLRKYNQNFLELLSKLYPYYNWKVNIKYNNLFSNIYWENIENRKRFIRDFIEEFKIKSFSQFKAIPKEILIENGGFKLFPRYYEELKEYSKEYLKKKSISNFNPLLKDDKNDDSKNDNLNIFYKFLNKKPTKKYLFVNQNKNNNLNNNNNDNIIYNNNNNENDINNVIVDNNNNNDNITEDNNDNINNNEIELEKEEEEFKCKLKIRKKLDKIALENNIKSEEDWNKITNKEFIKMGGTSLILKYKSSLFHLLKNNYPEKKFDELSRKVVPHHFWSKKENRRNFLEDFRKIRNFPMEMWYSIRADDVARAGGVRLIHIYNGSLAAALMDVFPEYNWNLFKFQVPKGYWDDVNVQRKFLEEISSKLKINSLEDWYSVTNKDISRLGGSALLKRSTNLLELLKKVYPHHEWDPMKLSILPKGFWSSLDNQREFLDGIAKIFSIRSTNDWYKIRHRDIIENNGAGLLKKYNGSFFTCLRSVFPDQNWDIFKSSSSKKHLYFSERNFLVQVQKHFLVEQKNDWYRISQKQINKLRGGPTFHYKLTLFRSLCNNHPNEGWNFADFLRKTKKSSQRWLFVCLRILFREHVLLEEYCPPFVQFETSNIPVELDVFIPSFNVGVDYHGEQHYDDCPAVFSDVKLYKMRDLEKRDLLLDKLNYVVVPYWWNQEAHSLKEFLSHFSLFKII